MAKPKPDTSVDRAVENAEQALHFAHRHVTVAHSAQQVAAVDRALSASSEARRALGTRSA